MRLSVLRVACGLAAALLAAAAAPLAAVADTPASCPYDAFLGTWSDAERHGDGDRATKRNTAQRSAVQHADGHAQAAPGSRSNQDVLV